MEHLTALQNQIVSFVKTNPKISAAIAITSVSYIASLLYRKYKYSQEIFNNKNERSTKVIIITGCDTGFGNETAMRLSIDYGYKIIATCLKKESVDKFLSNKLFTANGSTSTLLDVTNSDQIQSLYSFTTTYLNDNNPCCLWGIVNNAGLGILGPFEFVSQSLSTYQYNVLLHGPLNIIRILLPLIYGRKNYKNMNNLGIKVSNGGRIVNVSSVAAKIIGDTRYGPSKCALSHFTHGLRMELSLRFGIWCSTIEPAAFATPIFKSMQVWTNKTINDAKQNNAELLDIYKKDIVRIQNRKMENMPKLHYKNDKVVNNIIHALNAKYPKREYLPGTDSLFWSLILKMPISMQEWLTISAVQREDKQLKDVEIRYN